MTLDNNDTLEWGTPVLYLRASEGRRSPVGWPLPAAGRLRGSWVLSGDE
jgi:hypothetical protein